ncbi:MAG: alpha-glucan family phosphorylase [Pseudomonadota bacterium]|nr:MAG: alpha-glucan family phosphorylase [Pseudomonadota bacterium]
MTGTQFSLEVQPQIPERLARLEDLANDLLYSWDRSVRGLFHRLDRDLWHASGHNPKVFLRRVAQEALEEAVDDRVFMEDFLRVLTSYDAYLRETMRPGMEELLDPGQDLVAYFCAEFGFHESFPIYSGGLGILAGDHCKAASDLGIPFVAVGLLYRQGYFTQTIDAHGNQVAHYTPTHFDDLPVVPATDPNGNQVQFALDFPERKVHVRVWKARAGHITLYLLDTDVPGNSEHDRSITHQLYGGDTNTRIQQEIVLGIGGVRALRALGLRPTVWHINEGHAAFLILERCRERIASGMDFDSALELVASGSVFTTHPPVAAGHDIFDEELITTYFNDFAVALGLDIDTFHSLGSSPSSMGGFNMTTLALRGTRFHNGVSRIHGAVASRMEGFVWPQIPNEENPIGHITNGVHVPTFLAREWANLFDMRFREWRNQLLNPDYWDCIDDIPDHRYWSLHQSLKQELLEEVYERALLRHRRNGASEALVERITRRVSQTDADVLMFGFARRFATYKRATLLFSDPERMARILNDPERPVILLFAGKAHPNDLPGQHLIQVIHEFSQRPEFVGKIILLEGYDMALARKLVTGVDVWLNTPEYPLEASGTSGQKAGINGVVNLSVLDGWWGEGYNGENGWAIATHDPQVDAAYRNREEASDLLDIIEHQVLPLYYDRDGHGYSDSWVALSKNSMKSIIPRFNSQRMVMDYVRNFYSQARARHDALLENQCAPARQLSEWKKKIRENWSGVSIRRCGEPPTRIDHNETLPIKVCAKLNGLSPDDVAVECLVGTNHDQSGFVIRDRIKLKPGATKGDEVEFGIDLKPELPGLQFYKLRMFPCHPLQSNAFETGYMVWV